MNECVMAFLVLSFLGSGQTFLTHRSDEEVGTDLSKNYHSAKSSPSTTSIEATREKYVCLEVSANLPPCNFDKIDYSTGKEGISVLSLSKSANNEREHKSYRRTIRENSFVIIYKLEGCLPSRLPFRLPLCKPNESFSRTAEVRRLYPFRTQGGTETTPLIFPEIDHNQWLQLMKNMGYHPEFSSEEKRNLDFELEKNLEEAREEQARPNRESESVNPVKRKSKATKKGKSNKSHHQDDWFQFQKKEPHQEKMQLFEFRPMMNEDVQITLFNAEKKIEEDAQEIRDLSQELDRLVAQEFPYSRAIPYDPAKLQVAREGSEFPYSKAIPFDPSKLEVARERSILPYWTEVPHRSGSFGVQPNPNEFTFPNELSFEDKLSYSRGSHKSRRLQSVNKDQEVFFDSSMLEAAKQGSIFPYSKEVPRDTSKKIQKSNGSTKNQNLVKINPEMENEEKDKKTRVPLRAIANQQTWISDRFKRRAEDSGNLRSWVNHRSRTLKTIKEGSEFPYSKAIPYDPKKLRPPGVRSDTEIQSHHQSRKLKVIQEGSEFPYTKAISYDPTKLVVPRRKSELIDSKIETDRKSEKHISRKLLAMNPGNSLSFALFVPHNRKASHHHSKHQKDM